MSSLTPSPSGGRRPSGYELGVHTFLSFFRFASLALAIALIFVVPRQPVTEPRTLLVASLVAVYTIPKVLIRFRLFSKASLTNVILAIDLAVCLAAILLTGGAQSPFLLYSLLPTITTALFFQRRLALAVAILTASNLIIAHSGLVGLGGRFPLILEDNYLTVILLYTMFCLLLATVSYHSNLNVYRHAQFEAIVEERRRLRREIHDGIAQVMGYLKTKTNLILKSTAASGQELLAAVDEINKVASESYYDIREAIDSLDVAAAAIPLDTALSSYIEEFQKGTDSKIELVVPPKLPALAPMTQIQLLRIVQEALSNVRKHASAKQVWVRLQSTARGLKLVVKDDGVGFSPEEQEGAGLGIMRERANSINGILAVTSVPGRGTEVSIEVPRG